MRRSRENALASCRPHRSPPGRPGASDVPARSRVAREPGPAGRRRSTVGRRRSPAPRAAAPGSPGTRHLRAGSPEYAPRRPRAPSARSGSRTPRCAAGTAALPGAPAAPPVARLPGRRRRGCARRRSKTPVRRRRRRNGTPARATPRRPECRMPATSTRAPAHRPAIPRRRARTVPRPCLQPRPSAPAPRSTPPEARPARIRAPPVAGSRRRRRGRSPSLTLRWATIPTRDLRRGDPARRLIGRQCRRCQDDQRIDHVARGPRQAALKNLLM